MAMLRLLGEEDVRAMMNADRALDLARETLRDQAAGRSVLSTPAAMTLEAEPFGGPRFRFKAATVGHLGASGLRLLSRRTTTDAAARNYCVVYDHAGSTITGLVSEAWLSSVRTAAFGAVTIERLVPSSPLVVGLYGAGRIAGEMVPMLARTLNMSELRVNSRRPESMAGFVARHTPTVSFPIRAEPDQARMPVDADLLITLTGSQGPVVRPGSLKPGLVICSMGSYNELDYGVLEQAERLIVDDPASAAEMGDGGAWIQQGHLSRVEFASRVDALACEVVTGRKPGRLAQADRILALLQGMAIGDVAFAAWALREAARLGRGTTLELS